MKTQTADKFIESSLRTAVRSVLTSLEKGAQPELVDRLLSLTREVRKPQLDELSVIVTDFATRLQKAEETLHLVQQMTNIRQPTPRMPGPASVLQRNQ